MNRFVLVSFIAFLNSCTFQKVPSSVKQKFIYCINEHDSSENSKFDLSGYYEFFRYKKDTNGKIVLKGDSSSSSRYLFFKDGTFMIIRHPKRNLESDFEAMISYEKQSKKHPGYYNSDWGAYRIFGDTIKAQFVNHLSVMAENRMFLYEEWFLIINYTTIKRIGGRPLVAFDGGKQIKDDNAGYVEKYNEERSQPALFVKVKNIPPPNSWLKNEKWFWCNEKDYLNWRNK